MIAVGYCALSLQRPPILGRRRRFLVLGSWFFRVTGAEMKGLLFSCLASRRTAAVGVTADASLGEAGRVPGRRVWAVDWLRGVALTMVLVDHMDLTVFSWGVGGFRNWTLMGLGFSDAAQWFVFLSGVSFALACAVKLAEPSGWWRVQRWMLWRAAVIYAAMMLTAVLVAGLGRYQLGHFAINVYQSLLPTEQRGWQGVWRLLSLQEHPYALGILCLYVVVLPLLPSWLWLWQRCWPAAAAITVLVYAVVPAGRGDWQPAWVIGLPGQGWGFNPWAWQLLYCLGAVVGSVVVRARRSRRSLTFRWQWHGCWLVLSLGLVAWGLVVHKGSLVGWGGDPSSWWMVVGSGGWASKSKLGLLCLAHFAAVAYLVWVCWPRAGRQCGGRRCGGRRCGGWGWLAVVLQSFAVCGRHPLPLYCLGVLMTYLTPAALMAAGVSRAAFLVLVADAVLIQFLAGMLLERRRTERAERGEREEGERKVAEAAE